MASAILHKAKLFGELTAFSHSVFALPFALAMIVVVSRTQSIPLINILWIIVCVLAARTSAMAWNRFLDASIDRENVRTLSRPIPRGAVSNREALFITVLSGALFVLASFCIGSHCGVLAPLVLGLLLAYSAMKRITAAAHLVLGVALACAPGGVWYALVGTFSWIPVPLMAGVALWVCGFDILYSCQDADFDRSRKLQSVPARFGIPAALNIAKITHFISFLLLILFGMIVGLGIVYFVGVTIFALFVMSQHFVITPKNVSAIDRAFFTRNGLASLVFLAAVVGDRLATT